VALARRATRRRARAALLALALATFSAWALAGCGDTVHDHPIPHNILEGLLLAHTPVYWVGVSFKGFQVTGATHDPGGAFTVQYGDCLQGGQATCVTPLLVVSSPDNSFLPGAAGPHQSGSVRGVSALLARGGRTIELATGPVAVDIYAARDARLAAAAARHMVPINAPGAPGEALPPPQPDSGFARKPLPSQLPSPVRTLG
jgi:hypothetical protein